MDVYCFTWSPLASHGPAVLLGVGYNGPECTWDSPFRDSQVHLLPKASIFPGSPIREVVTGAGGEERFVMTYWYSCPVFMEESSTGAVQARDTTRDYTELYSSNIHLKGQTNHALQHCMSFQICYRKIPGPPSPTHTHKPTQQKYNLWSQGSLRKGNLTSAQPSKAILRVLSCC